MAIEEKKLYTVQQAAVELRRTQASVRRLIRLEHIPTRSEGRRLYILGSDLLQLERVRPLGVTAATPVPERPSPPPPPDSKIDGRTRRLRVTAQIPPGPQPPPPDSRVQSGGRVSQPTRMDDQPRPDPDDPGAPKTRVR